MPKENEVSCSVPFLKFSHAIDYASLARKQWGGYYVKVNFLLVIFSTTQGLFSNIKFSFENIARLTQSVENEGQGREYEPHVGRHYFQF